MAELRTVDAIAAGLLSLAALRGLWIGAIGELFSLAGLGAATFAVRTWRLPFGGWLEAHSPVAMTGLAARLLAALALGLGTLLAVALLRRVARRGVRRAGLGLADRAAGGLLGALEGAVVAGALVLGLSALLGRDDGALAGSRSLRVLEWTEAQLGVTPRAPANEARRER